MPLIPLDEVVGREGTLPPVHIESNGPKLNTGVIVGLTVTDNEAGKPHCPLDGVNV